MAVVGVWDESAWSAVLLADWLAGVLSPEQRYYSLLKEEDEKEEDEEDEEEEENFASMLPRNGERWRMLPRGCKDPYH